jgi:hypothetical protein
MSRYGFSNTVDKLGVSCIGGRSPRLLFVEKPHLDIAENIGLCAVVFVDIYYVVGPTEAI